MAGSERWEHVEQLLDRALDLAPVDRVAFLNQACEGDAALRTEVEGLLRAAEQGSSFLREPAPAYAAPLVSRVAEAEALPPGARLGAYEIVRELGRGGMATVYLARDLKHERPVALKLLHAELAAALGPERFLREIRQTAQMRHPHILPVFDSGETEGRLWYTMPYMEGESLRQRLRRERQLPVEAAVRITRQVAEALDYAHRQGVVHRDIKPENILLEDGQAVLADFGIARAIGAAGEDQLTGTGFLLGTPAYMSPEQAAGQRDMDGRSDIYSLGCVLYEMLAGEPAFTGPTPQAVIAGRLTDPVPRVSAVRAVPPALEVAVTRALARSPADRYSSAAAFAEALLTTGDTPVGAPTAEAPTSRRRLVLAVVGALVVGVIAVGAATMLGSRLRPEVRAAPSHRQLTFTGSADGPAFSPDGKSIAYVSERRALVVQAIEGGEPVTLVPPARYIASPRWSPKGEWLYFTMVRDTNDPSATYRVPTRGGRAEKVLDHALPFDVAPDGKALVRRLFDTLRFEDVTTGAIVSRIPIRGAIRDTIPNDLRGRFGPIALSPDGKWIAFSWVDPEFSGVAVVSADGRSFARVAPGGWPPIRWVSSGDALYYLVPSEGGADLQRIGFDPKRGQPIDSPVVVLSGLPWVFTEETEFDLSPDGRTLAYVRGPQSQRIWALDLRRHSPGDTTAARQVTRGTRLLDWAALSPDGGTLAFLQLDGPFDWNFYWVPFEGGPATALTHGPRGYKGNPSWSPDGSRFVYLALDSAAPALMMTDRAGHLRERIGTRPPAYVGLYRPSWSADGRTLVYPADGGRTQVILDVRTRTERLVPSPDSLGHVPGIVMAPDGSELLAAEWRRDTVWARLWRTAVDSPAWSPVPAPSGDNFPLVWSPDGWVYLFNDRSTYFRPLDDLPTIWRMRPDGSRQELYARLPVACLKGFVTMSADGRRLACAVLEREPDVWLAMNFDPERP